MNKTPLNIFFSSFFAYDICAKKNLLTGYEIPKIKNITIFITNPNLPLKQIIYSIYFIQLFFSQKPYLLLKKNKKNSSLNILINTKTGSILGCKITLNKINIIQQYTYFLMYMIPKNKLYSTFNKAFTLSLYKKKINTISFTLKDLTTIPLMEQFYIYFQHLSNITITFTFLKKYPLRIALNLINLVLKKK